MMNKMELRDFINHFAEQFDDTNINEFKAETNFRTLDEWSSLVALSIIAMVDEEYNVTLQGKDMKAAATIGDLFNIVQSKL